MGNDLQNSLQEIYEHEWEQLYCAAEIAYYKQEGCLPKWSCFIEIIEQAENGELIIVHKDKTYDN